MAAYAPSLTEEEIQEVDCQESLQIKQNKSSKVSTFIGTNNVIEDTQIGTNNVIESEQLEEGWIDVKVTAYDLSVRSCGKKETHKAYGISRSGYSLRGHTRESALTIAVDPEIIPLGSLVKIEFYIPEYQKYNNIYIARDTGRLIKGQIIDLFMGDYGDSNSKEAMRFGVTEAKITIIK